jgi:uncharacterized lipoprotein YddW (UPF0748 family)
MTSKDISKTNAHARNLKAIAWVDKYLASATQVILAGTTYTPPALKAALQAQIDADNAVDDLRAQYRQQVVVAKGARTSGRAAWVSLKAYVLSTYGRDAAQVLEEFGISAPKKPGPKTAKGKALASEGATATRKAKKEALAHVANGSSAPSATPPGPTGTPSH